MRARAIALALLLCCLPAWAQQLAAIPALDSPVVDTTGTLDAAREQQLEQQARALQAAKGSQLQVLVVASTQPETIEQYTQRVFDQWQLGRKGVDDAVILVVAKDDRRVRIQPGYGLEGAIPDAIANRIIQEYLAPKFRAGDFGGGIADATAQLARLMEGESLPPPVSGNRAESRGGGDWMFALFAAFIAATFLRGLLSRAPKGLRSVVTGAGAGGVAWLLSSLLPVAGIAAFIGLVYGLMSASAGRYASHGGWGGFGGGGGGGGWGGGGMGGGGGWSGGGGMSGGGGASGSW